MTLKKIFIILFLIVFTGVSQAQVTAGKFYKIISKSSGKCIQVRDSSTLNGAIIEQGTYAESKHQHFKLATAATSGYFKINPVISGKCFDIVNGSTADGATVQQWDCWTGDMQQYSIQSTGDGYYQITVKSSSKCLGVDNNLMTNGAAIKQQTYTGADNQKWQFIEVLPYGYINGIAASQIGYKTNDRKMAVLLQTNAAASMTFTLIDDKNTTVFTDTMISYGDKWTKKYYTMDFSSFKTAGTYRLQSNGYTSYPFVINDKVWRTETRLPEYFTSFFDYQRCTETKEPADSNLNAYIRIGDNSAPVFQNFSRDERYGWFSATSHDKHITEQTISMNNLMWANLYNPDMFASQKKNGVPAIIDEIRWSMNFILKMQDADGGMFVSVHPGRASWQGIEVPVERHVFVNKLTGVTARAVSSFALGYTIFKNIDMMYAKKLLDAARKSYSWIDANPNNYPPDSVRPPYWNGKYDSRIMAAVELYIATKDDFPTEAQTYKTFADNAITNGTMVGGFWYSKGAGKDYGAVDQLLSGDIIYALSRYYNYSTGSVKTKINSSILTYFNYWKTRRNNPIGWIDDIVVSWFGSCGYNAMASNKFMIAGLATNNSDMINLAKDLVQVDYGINPFQRTYVYGTGENTFPDIFARKPEGSIGAVAPGIKIYNGVPVDDYRISSPDYSTGEACIPYTPGLIMTLALMDKANLTIPDVSAVKSGHSYIFKVKSNNKVCAVENASTVAGGNVAIETFNDKHEQKWIAYDVTGGYVKFINVNSGKCLEVAGTPIKDGNNIQQGDYTGADGQLWKVVPADSGFCKILNKTSNSGLDVYNNQSADGSNIQLWYNWGGANQMWVVKEVLPLTNGDTCVLKAKHSGKIAEVADSLMTNGGNIQQMSYHYTNNQKWIIHDAGNGIGYFTNLKSNKCIETASYSNADGGNIQQWDYLPNNYQQWQILGIDEFGYYKIINLGSSKVMEVDTALTTNGANIQQKTYSGGDNQKWDFELAKIYTNIIFIDPDKSILIYPNPTSDQLFIKNNELKIEKVTLTDLSGCTVYQSNSAFTGDKTIQLNSFTKGMYFITINGDNFNITKKIIIQ